MTGAWQGLVWVSGSSLSLRARDQGVPQGADAWPSRSDPGFEIYAGLPLAFRMAGDEIRLLQ